MKRPNKIPAHHLTLDPPVPRMALKRQGEGSFGGGAKPLPAPLPAGQMPPEDSRIWLFVPKAVQRGEEFIQDDTIEWFSDREKKVQISREYLDHPRWLHGGAAAQTKRGKLHNGNIISEVHLLARINAGLPEVPAWIPAQLSVKQLQNDVSYKLTKLTRKVLLTQGEQIMKDFAERTPGQFIKFVGATFVARKVEDVTPAPERTDRDEARRVYEALLMEVKRREDELHITALQGGNDYDGADVVGELDKFAVGMREQSKGYGRSSTGLLRLARDTEGVIDVLPEEPTKGEEDEQVEWD